MFNHRPLPSPIQTVKFDGLVKPNQDNSDAPVAGVCLMGTITQKDGAAVKFLISSGRDGGATIFGNNGGKGIENAWSLMEALTATMRTAVTQNDTEETDLSYFDKGVINFQIDIHGNVTSDAPITGRAIRVTESLGYAVWKFRRTNPYLFVTN